MNPKEDDLVLCTVIKVEGTTVFVDLEGTNLKGSIVFSEIAAGRIRNIRAHVSPNKKIVCKVLKVYPDHFELTLRRVTAGERDEVLENHKKETTFKKIISSIISNPEKTIEKIKESYELSDFLEEARESPNILEKYFSTSQTEQLQKILSEKKESQKALKKTFKLSSNSPDGLNDIKAILSIDKEQSKIQYLGSSKFSIAVSHNNPKEAEKILQSVLEQIEKSAKQKHSLFSIKEK